MNGHPDPVWCYVIAVGSNQRHQVHGCPRRIAVVAARFLRDDVRLIKCSRIIVTAPIGPSRRQFANAVWLVETTLMPDQLLDHLHHIERDFGRRRRGQRWSARVLDLDIILWSGGIWTDAQLCIPHPQWRNRRFVIDPAQAIVPDWRDPVTNRSVRQITARHRKLRPRLRD